MGILFRILAIVAGVFAARLIVYWLEERRERHGGDRI